MSIPAVIGTVCISLANLPGDPYYYQFPMGIIGKVYANSMIALINSQIVLGPEETPLTIISAFKFAMVSTNTKDSAINAYNGDGTVHTKVLAGHLRGSHPEGV